MKSSSGFKTGVTLSKFRFKFAVCFLTWREDFGRFIYIFFNMTLPNSENYRDPRFSKDDIIQRINNFVTLQNGEKKLNTAHLERVIKEGLIPLMKKQDSLFEKRYNSIMHGGSYYKNTKVGKPEEYDLDLIICLPWKQDTLKFETPERKPGFVKIKLTENSKLPEWEIYHGTQLAKFINSKCYIDQNKFREWMESVITKTLEPLPKDPNFLKNGKKLKVNNLHYSIATKKSGPAFTFMIKVPEGHVIDVDLVACLEFSIPPPKRYKGFKNETKKWLAIPKPLTEADGNLMWRLCFYQHEKDRLKGPMKTVIRLLKKLRDTQNWKNFASYYIETLALHELESNDSRLMNLPLTCLFMHMLRRLRDASKAHFIAFFWCKEMNLLDKLSKIEMENIAGRLTQIVAKIEREHETDPYIIASYVLKSEELEQMKSQEIHIRTTEITEKLKPMQETNEKASEMIFARCDDCRPTSVPGLNTINDNLFSSPSLNGLKIFYSCPNTVRKPFGVLEETKEDKIIQMLFELKQELREVKDAVQNLSEKVDKLERIYEVPIMGRRSLLDFSFNFQ